MAPLSLLGRLVGDDHQEVFWEDSIADILRENIRINIENLLNTKRSFLSWKPCYKQLVSSIINYGIDDFSGLWIDSLESCEGFCRQIETAIRLFEPRINNLVVYLEESPGLMSRTLQLRMEGKIKEGTEVESVVFHSMISSSNYLINLKAYYSSEKIYV